MNTIIVYGSYGYTGKLIVEECKSKGLNVILAGRNQEALQKHHEETGYPFEAVDVSNAAGLKNLLIKGEVLINCGGPFKATAKYMVEACLETNTHYLDITGEYQVFELLAQYDQRAKEIGITILPGVGYDVIPPDCLALHLKKRLPSATHLQIAFRLEDISRGTAKTIVQALGEGAIRKDGKIVSAPIAGKMIHIEYRRKKVKCMNMPLADVFSAWASTGIPNIEAFKISGSMEIKMAQMSDYFVRTFGGKGIKSFLSKLADKKPGPSKAFRDRERGFVWGKVWDDAGKECVSTVETLEPYTLTGKSSVLIAKKIMNGNLKPGYQTPAKAYGADLVMELETTVREDIV